MSRLRGTHQLVVDRTGTGRARDQAAAVVGIGWPLDIILWLAMADRVRSGPRARAGDGGHAAHVHGRGRFRKAELPLTTPSLVAVFFLLELLIFNRVVNFQLSGNKG